MKFLLIDSFDKFLRSHSHIMNMKDFFILQHIIIIVYCFSIEIFHKIRIIFVVSERK